MPFKPGHKKTGGRKKGSPNKPTKTLMQKAVELGVDPFEVLLRIAKDDWRWLGCGGPCRIDLRKEAAAEACQYLYPKRKAIEHTGADGEPLFQTLVDVVKEVAKDTQSVKQPL